MNRITCQIIAIAAAALVSARAYAGTISYVAISSTDSDTSCGISADNTYTSAVDGGNTSGTDRVVNGVTLVTLSGSGATSAANNVTLNALSGSLANGAGAAASIEADGVLADVLKDMTFNNGATDGSQQEIVLDPASLTAGATYDLRVYICNPSGQNRAVDLSFACDGQAAVDTGYFNEDDATTCGGGFTDKNQAYYINYRYTWDGATTPGITITQKSGATPFCLYALTNQLVGGAEAPATAASDTAAATQAVDMNPVGSLDSGGEAAQGQDVGVLATQFTDCDCLNNHGTWVDVTGYGRCWHPSGVDVNWCPYTHGHWCHSDCGWTWVCSGEEDQWGWACYHYGRWCRESSVGWCWVPGRVWASSWVSWRVGGGCVGWAPLPPEATCRVGVGISTWVDSTCGLGPGAYSFCHTQDFGSENVSSVIISRQQNTTIIQQTTNVTNIVNNRTVIYNGGPNVAAVNKAISAAGKKPVQTDVVIRRSGVAGPVAGGKHTSLQGNTLTLTGPKVTAVPKGAKLPPVTTTIKTPKIDKGWNQVTDPGAAAKLKQQIANESKGKTAQNTKAVLPAGVALKQPTIPRAVKFPTPAPGGKLPGTGPEKKAVVKHAPGGPSSTPVVLHPGQPVILSGTTKPFPTPVRPLATPVKPFPTPLATPNPARSSPSVKPLVTPAGKHPGQPVKPLATPVTPLATPVSRAKPSPSVKPLATPVKPQATPVKPLAKHAKPLATPVKPHATPVKPLATPPPKKPAKAAPVNPNAGAQAAAAKQQQAAAAARQQQAARQRQAAAGKKKPKPTPTPVPR